jgi:hypothetical protein
VETSHQASTNQGGEVLRNHDILVIDNQKPIVGKVLGTQIKGKVDTLVGLQPHPLSTSCGASGNVESGGDCEATFVPLLPVLQGDYA